MPKKAITENVNEPSDTKRNGLKAAVNVVSTRTPSLTPPTASAITVEDSAPYALELSVIAPGRAPPSGTAVVVAPPPTIHGTCELYTEYPEKERPEIEHGALGTA